MARARNIKPGFFRNEELSKLTSLARLLFAGLWTIADRDGRLEDRPMRIKADVLPYDRCDVDSMLAELEKHQFIIRYIVDGVRFISIPTWKKHQSPHYKEQPSTIPEPVEPEARLGQAPVKPEARPGQAPDKPSSSRASSLIPSSLIPSSLIPSSLIPSLPDSSEKPSSPKSDEETGEFSLAAQEEQPEAFDFDEHFKIWWDECCWHKTGKPDALRAFEKCLKRIAMARMIHIRAAFDYLMEETISYLERFRDSPEWERWRKNLHPATYLNGDRWADRSEDQAA